MLNEVLGIIIAILALAWIFDILHKLPSPLLAWLYAAIMYGLYLLFAVVLCGYDGLAPILAPTPLFIALAITQVQRPKAGPRKLGGKLGARPARRRPELDEITRELRAAIRQAELQRPAPADDHPARSSLSK